MLEMKAQLLQQEHAEKIKIAELELKRMNEATSGTKENA
jgi:hypothetical protein